MSHKYIIKAYEPKTFEVNTLKEMQKIVKELLKQNYEEVSVYQEEEWGSWKKIE